MSDFAVGFAAGIVTNLIAWWILYHVLVPRINFSPSISRTTRQPTQDNKSGYRYRIRFENSGRRSIIDIEVTATLRIKGLGEHPKTDWKVFDVPLTSDGSAYRVPRLLPYRKERIRRIPALYINSVEVLPDDPDYPEIIRKKAMEKTLMLEDLLGLGTRASFQVIALGYDEFSGARKLFSSKYYTLDDIREDSFGSKERRVDEQPVEHTA